MYVYILTCKSNTVLYVGVTDDICRRIREHKSGIIEGFTKKYHVDKLVYYEEYKNPNEAIKREKQLKKWTRAKKIHLIESQNIAWNDLTDASLCLK